MKVTILFRITILLLLCISNLYISWLLVLLIKTLVKKSLCPLNVTFLLLLKFIFQLITVLICFLFRVLTMDFDLKSIMD